MPDYRPPVPCADQAAGACPDGEPPDLGPLRAVASGVELADAALAVADSYGRPLAGGDPLTPLARDAARSLTEAGFTLHHCAQHHPLHPLGGVCLLPVARTCDPGGTGGVVVSWTTHHLLSRDWYRWDEYDSAREVMNGALAQVLDALRYQVRPIRTGRRVDRDRPPGPWRGNPAVTAPETCSARSASRRGGECPTARPAHRTAPPPAAHAPARPHQGRAARRRDDDDLDLDAYVREVVDGLPPLTEEQRDQLALIFRSKHRE
ncbi:MAG: hypothetical protein ACR2FU_06300 [Streptosporangiaceae bacterium]